MLSLTTTVIFTGSGDDFGFKRVGRGNILEEPTLIV